MKSLINSRIMSPTEKMEETERNMDDHGKEDHKNHSPMSYNRIASYAKHIMDNTLYRPKLAIICGSGLSGIADVLNSPDVIEYSDIPYFPTSTIRGHKSRFLFGNLEGACVMIMQGRFHHYEGYSMSTCGMPVRVMKLIGVESLIITNVAGSINPSFKVGDIMIIKDHVNFPGFAGKHPLNGPKV